MEECSSDYQRWTKLPVLKSGDDDGNATLFELRPSLSSHSHTIHQVHGVCDWQMVQTEWALLLYKQHPRRWERHTSILLPCIAIISLSLSLSEQKKKKWWELISGSSSITISSPCVIRWALIKPSFFVFNEIIVILFLCDTVEDFRFWGLVWFLWFFQ